MRNPQNKQIEVATKKLRQKLHSVAKCKPPHTIFVTIWDDGDFSIGLRSCIFDGKQSEEIRKEEYSVRIIQIDTISRWKQRGMPEFRVSDAIVQKCQMAKHIVKYFEV